MNNLPSVLIELRKKNLLTQQAVAEKLNISTQAYARYEKGLREPSIDSLIILADLYSVPIDILVGRYAIVKKSTQ